MGTAQVAFVEDCVVDGDVTGSCVTGSGEPEMTYVIFPPTFKIAR
jgi:hypothetical protein